MYSQMRTKTVDIIKYNFCWVIDTARNFNITTFETHRSERALIMAEFCHFPASVFAIHSCGFHFHIVNFISIINFIFVTHENIFLELSRTRCNANVYRLEIYVCLKAWCTINAFIANTKAVTMDYIHYSVTLTNVHILYALILYDNISFNTY